MQALKEWFFGLESNEQKAVSAAAVVVSIMIIVFGVLTPMNDAVNSAQQKVKAREGSVADWKAALPTIFANRGSGASSSNLALNNVVTTTTRQFQLRLSRVEEKSATEMHVWFDNIPFNDFVRWVAELESKHNIKVESVNIRSKDRDGLSSIDIKLLRG